jgi:hypothetical protein
MGTEDRKRVAKRRMQARFIFILLQDPDEALSPGSISFESERATAGFFGSERSSADSGGRRFVCWRFNEERRR